MAAPQYAAFFDRFNRGQYFEAHCVLEELWRSNPGGNYGFYKGLIQLAGAFVHVQKSRQGPAVALLKLALTNLAAYPRRHNDLDVGQLLRAIQHWLDKLATCVPGAESSLLDHEPPRIALISKRRAGSASRSSSA